MRDLDLAYLAHLVKRDGDSDLQSFYGIDRESLSSQLMSLAKQIHTQNCIGDIYHVPIIPEISVYKTRYANIKYTPWR